MSVVEHQDRVRSRAPRGAIWPFLSDTERLNRFIGSGPVSFAPVDEGSARFALVTPRATSLPPRINPIAAGTVMMNA